MTQATTHTCPARVEPQAVVVQDTKHATQFSFDVAGSSLARKRGVAGHGWSLGRRERGVKNEK